MISENSDHHPPEYVTPRNLNGNTHGWFGLRLSEVVWHVEAEGTGWLVVIGGLVVADGVVGADGLVGPEKDKTFYEIWLQSKNLDTRYG